MRYTVTWLPSIEGRLATIWQTSSRRNDIAAAANEIDKRLRRDPQAAGLRFDEELWQLIVGPLAVLYSISEADMLVKVVDVDEMPP